MAETPQHFEISPEEAKFLREQLEAKKPEYKEGTEFPEKTHVKEVLKEYVARHEPSISAPTGAAPLSSDEHVARLEHLLSVAFSESIFKALKEAQKHGPHFVDEFHDVLADHLYEKLVVSGLIKQV